MSDEGSPPKASFVERRLHPRVAKEPLGLNEAQNGGLVPVRFETTSLPATRQFPAWQEHIATLLDCRLPDGVGIGDGFEVEQIAWNLGGMLVVQQTTPAFSYERPPEKVRFSPIDHWHIIFLRTGRSWTEMDGHVVQNEPDMMEVRSLGRPFRGRKLATTAISLIVPVDLFADHGGLPPSSSNVVLGGNRVRLLTNYLSSVEANLEHFTHDDLPRVRSRLKEMMLDAVLPLVDRDSGKDRVSQAGLMARARSLILNNISSPALTAEMLCRELAISRTRLYELFEAAGGVANYIRRRRLLAAHAMISDSTDRRKIAEVGMAFGFDSAANFSRAFTQQFGYSPSKISKYGSPRDRSSRHAEVRSDQHQPTFDNWLRTLGHV